MRVRKHDQPALDLDLRVSDSSVGRSHTHAFRRVECFFVEVDRGCGAIDREVRRDARIVFGNGTDSHVVLILGI